MKLGLKEVFLIGGFCSYDRIMSGEQCCENPPALNTSSGKGVVLDDYGGLKSYVVGSHNSTKAIILISDVFGMFLFFFNFPPNEIKQSG